MIDIVIIGSGFGGAVLAARLAAGRPGASILVIEKGDDPTGLFDPRSLGDPPSSDGNRFRNTLSPSYLARWAELWTDPDGAYKAGTPSMQVLGGKGLGGGSNLYDGVSLRAPAEAFEQTRLGQRLWPTAYSRAALDRYYAKVEAALKVARLQWTDASAPHWQLATRRDLTFAEGCRRIGATALPLKLADDQDANDGWWNEGQRKRGRQSLTQNYLLLAQSAGVSFQTGSDVDTIAPTAGGYVVAGHDRRDGSDFEITCKMLVVAGGAVGSTGLLMRSTDQFASSRPLDPGAQLGRALSANGDYGVSGIVGDAYAADVDGHKGKPMSSFCPSFFSTTKAILIPFYAAPLYLALGQFSTLLRAQDPGARGRGSTGVAAGERDWGLAYKQRIARFGRRMLTMGCLCLDDGEGEIRLDANRRPTVRWAATSAQTEARWSAAVDAMAKIYAALGGEMYLDAYRKDGTVHTSHPLGGCRMANDPAHGVVDAFGEVFGQRNLFVVDGAIIPSALGANPSLTIAAVAEMIADRLVRGDGTESLISRLA
jgi:choline dehydrogenase-like flavoprotein